MDRYANVAHSMEDAEMERVLSTSQGDLTRTAIPGGWNPQPNSTADCETLLRPQVLRISGSPIRAPFCTMSSPPIICC